MVVIPDKFLVIPKMHLAQIKKLLSRRRWKLKKLPSRRRCKLRKLNGLPKKPPVPAAVKVPLKKSPPPTKPEPPDGPPTKPEQRP